MENMHGSWSLGHCVTELTESGLNTLITRFHYLLYGLYTYITSNYYLVMLFYFAINSFHSTKLKIQKHTFSEKLNSEFQFHNQVVDECGTCKESLCHEGSVIPLTIQKPEDTNLLFVKHQHLFPK